jgi:hypothetical protein
MCFINSDPDRQLDLLKKPSSLKAVLATIPEKKKMAASVMDPIASITASRLCWASGAMEYLPFILTTRERERELEREREREIEKKKEV